MVARRSFVAAARGKYTKIAEVGSDDTYRAGREHRRRGIDPVGKVYPVDGAPGARDAARTDKRVGPCPPVDLLGTPSRRAPLAGAALVVLLVGLGVMAGAQSSLTTWLLAASILLAVGTCWMTVAADVSGWPRANAVIEASFVAVCVASLAGSAAAAGGHSQLLSTAGAVAGGAWIATAYAFVVHLERGGFFAMCAAAVGTAPLAAAVGQTGWAKVTVVGVVGALVLRLIATARQRSLDTERTRLPRVRVLANLVLAAAAGLAMGAVLVTLADRGGVAPYRSQVALCAGVALALVAVRAWITSRQRADALRALQLMAARHGQVVSQLQARTRLDPLTGVANRVALMERLAAATARLDERDRYACLLYLDLDDFKPVNDQLGHAAGDLLLAQVAQRLLASSHTSDLVARIGGDEFAVLVEDLATLRHAEDLAVRLLERLDSPFRVAGVELLLNASVGVAVLLPGTSSGSTAADEALAAADAAMYRAKRAGKNRYALADSWVEAKSWPGLSRGRRSAWPGS